jgi:hypothetical protein
MIRQLELHLAIKVHAILGIYYPRNSGFKNH